MIKYIFTHMEKNNHDLNGKTSKTRIMLAQWQLIYMNYKALLTKQFIQMSIFS